MAYLNTNLTYIEDHLPYDGSPFWYILDECAVWLLAFISTFLWFSFTLLLCASPLILRFLYIRNEIRQANIAIASMTKVFVLPALNGGEPQILTEEDIMASERYVELVNALPNYRVEYGYLNDLEAFVKSQLLAMTDEDIELRQ